MAHGSCRPAASTRYIIKAKAYIDATGDGRLGAEAGAEWIQGQGQP